MAAAIIGIPEGRGRVYTDGILSALFYSLSKPIPRVIREIQIQLLQENVIMIACIIFLMPAELIQMTGGSHPNLQFFRCFFQIQGFVVLHRRTGEVRIIVIGFALRIGSDRVADFPVKILRGIL